MPSKRNGKTRAVSPIEDDDDLLLSQYSRALSSEDHELECVLVVDSLHS